MEEVLSSLRSAVDDTEFLRLTRTALRIIQNLLNDPENGKFRTVRASCKYVQKAGISQLLEAVGFKKKDEDYTLESEQMETLLEKKLEIVKCRKEVGTVMGWDVPSSSLKFSLIQDKGRFGDIFLGQMDNQDVTMKVVRPDCNQEAKCAFDRELDALSKVSHPNITKLLAVTLTSEPTALILEHIPRRLLDFLHSSEAPEREALEYGRQLGSAIHYLHQKDILHCDLAARNLLLAANNKLRLSEFGLSRWAGTLSCRLPPSARHTLNVRWHPPETLTDLIFSKHSDVWSFGVVLYELLTGGSVPYATFSNSEVQSKVEEGFRLPQPQGCPEDLYHLMQLCWARRPTDRPHFSDILRTHLDPLTARLLTSEAKSPCSTPTEEGDHKGLHSKPSKKVKVKELSYPSVIGKGGGLVRVYTALVSPLQYRVVVVCNRKSSVGEVVATALAKCGKEQDAKNHKLVLVSGPTSGSPAHYLDSEDKILSVKSGAPPTAMFVLCVNMPGQAPLEILETIRQNPAYGLAFSSSTRGYLVRREKGQGQRTWCVLDGSTLLCYKEEEDEGTKQFESHLDFKGCTVELSAKGRAHIFRVTLAEGDGTPYCFLATSKDDMLQWVESISSSKTLDPSPLLLYASGGAILHTGFVTCQEFSSDSPSPSSSSSSSSTSSRLQRSKISDVDFSGTISAIDYGKHWTVLRSTGLVQCLVKGKPETLFDLRACQRVKVNNPREMREGVDYCIEVESAESKFVLRSDLPTGHCDWVLAFEQILKKIDHAQVLQGHRKRESGYVALKRVLMTGQQQQQQVGGNRRASQMYCFPRIFDDMEDIYEPPPPPLAPSSKMAHPAPLKENAAHRSKLLLKPSSSSSEAKEGVASPPEAAVKQEDNIVPLPPKDYLPPPLPPRNDPPPIPPKSGSAPSSRRPTSSTLSSSGSCSDLDDDYIMMQSTRSSTAPSPYGTPHPPSTPRSLSMPQATSPSQPITIPNRRSSKKSILLRTDSESSSYTGSPTHQGCGVSGGGSGVVYSDHRKHSFSLNRQNSNQSLSSSSYSTNARHMSVSSVNSETPPLPPRNGEKRSSGYSSPIFYPSPSPGKLPQSNTMGGISAHAMVGGVSTFGGGGSRPASQSDGMTVTELQMYHSKTVNGRTPTHNGPAHNSPASHHHHPYHHPVSGKLARGPGPGPGGSLPRQLVSSYVSEGYDSDHSSAEDLAQVPAGWERGYCEAQSRYFYFHPLTGASTWSLREAHQKAELGTGSVEEEAKAGAGWRVARTDEGKTYYYHQETRKTTWNIAETFA